LLFFSAGDGEKWLSKPKSKGKIRKNYPIIKGKEGGVHGKN